MTSVQQVWLVEFPYRSQYVINILWCLYSGILVTPKYVTVTTVTVSVATTTVVTVTTATVAVVTVPSVHLTVMCIHLYTCNEEPVLHGFVYMLQHSSPIHTGTTIQIPSGLKPRLTILLASRICDPAYDPLTSCCI